MNRGWKKILLPVLVWGFMAAGCGYKPATAYTDKVLDKKIYTEVEVYLRDPENAVLAKDAVNQAVRQRFGGTLTDEAHADTKLFVRFDRVSFRPIQFDTNGYAIYYRAIVRLRIAYASTKGNGEEKVDGVYDFPIQPAAVISDALRYKAIKEGSLKAIDAFISKMAATGARL